MSSGETTRAGEASALAGPDQMTAQTGSQTFDRPAGELLRAAREAAGLHIAALAVMLKVPVKKLEALEASRFDLLPDMVFVRALASSVCRTLKVDSAPVLERLPHTGMPQLPYQGSGVNTPFRSPGDSPGPSAWSGVPKPAAGAVVLLLVASIAILFWPAVSGQFSQLKSAISARLTAGKGSIDAASIGAEPGLRGEKALGSVSAGPSDATGPTGAVIVQTPALATPQAGQTLFDASTAASATGVADMTPTSDVPANSIIVFRAVGESWVEVTDAKRQTVLRRTLAAGESVGVVGALPLAATVGRASVTQVAVRGQGFDLGPWSKDNVARFEVK